jgi:hypothetical protein
MLCFSDSNARLKCLFSVQKVPLNCTSAIKSLLHASVNSLSMIVQKVSVHYILVKLLLSFSVIVKDVFGTRGPLKRSLSPIYTGTS